MPRPRISCRTPSTVPHRSNQKLNGVQKVERSNRTAPTNFRMAERKASPAIERGRQIHQNQRLRRPTVFLPPSGRNSAAYFLSFSIGIGSELSRIAFSAGSSFFFLPQIKLDGFSASVAVNALV